MSTENFEISIKNANSTINKIHNILKDRNVSIKKSDVKEVISELLGYQTSNVLDKKIKEEKLRYEAERQFAKSGHHKMVDGLLLRRFTNPLSLTDFLNKNPQYKFIIEFSEDFWVTTGFRFREGDILFSTDRNSAIKVLIDWQNTVRINFETWESAGLDFVPRNTGGFWSLEFIGEGQESELGDAGGSTLCTIGGPDRINCLEVSPDLLEDFFIDMICQGEQKFLVQDRVGFFEDLHDWTEEYYWEVKDANEGVGFEQHVEKFIPYLSIQDIALLEMHQITRDELLFLESNGANLMDLELFECALREGNLAALMPLKNQSLIVAALLEETENGYTSRFHMEAAWCSLDSDDIDISMSVQFYENAVIAGVDINSQTAGGKTVLHFAAQAANVGLYEALVEIGADERIKDVDGLTSREILNRRLKEQAENPCPPFGLFFVR